MLNTFIEMYEYLTIYEPKISCGGNRIQSFENKCMYRLLVEEINSMSTV